MNYFSLWEKFETFEAQKYRKLIEDVNWKKKEKR